MRPSDALLQLFRFLLPPALILTLGLYLYAPLFDCTFPVAKRAEAGCSIPGQQQKDAVPAEIAPFRLLAFGDPQLEGDTSIPVVHWEALAAKWEHEGLRGLVEGVGEGMLGVLRGWRKRVDLWGNDLYLAQIYRSVEWWSQPSHVVVLGDLLGSQWISDEEFARRTRRFWGKVFRGGEKVPRSITESSGRVEMLGQDGAWSKRIIAVAGNHDIGYAGDIDEKRIERFEDAFGNVNWAITFRLSNSSSSSSPSNSHSVSPFSSNTIPGLSNDPELRLIILNSMNLDSPAKIPSLQKQSQDFAESHLSPNQLTHSSLSATVLLTHIPLHKPEGTCTDSEFFSFFPPSSAPDGGGGIKEQNLLSKGTSDFILGLLTKPSNRDERVGKAIILNGHDHEGCQTHHIRSEAEHGAAGEWTAIPLSQAQRSDVWTPPSESQSQTSSPLAAGPGVREITVRSMMGQYHGNAGFLSGWFDQEEGEWKFEYNSCMLGVQHIWWGIHVLDLVVFLLGVGGVVLMVLEEMRAAREEDRQRGDLKKTQ